MFPERRNRLIKILRSLVVWPAAVLAAAIVGFSAYAVLGLAPLAPWHSLELKEEFEARRDAQLDFAGLLALEGRLFEELRHAKVLRSSDLAEERSSRFSPASWVARLTGAPGDAGLRGCLRGTLQPLVRARAGRAARLGPVDPRSDRRALLDARVGASTARSRPACRRLAVAGAWHGAGWSAAHDPGGLARRRAHRSPPRCFAGVAGSALLCRRLFHGRHACLDSCD